MRRRGLVVLIALPLLAAPPAYAGSARDCRQLCRSAIRACAEGGGRVPVCRKRALRRCKRAGPHACSAATSTSTTSSTTTSTTTTTIGATTTTTTITRPTLSRIPVITCLGDSITQGATDALYDDPFGGYPGRLARRLRGRARVRGRGMGASTTVFWLLDPRTVSGRAAWEFVRAARWRHFTAREPDSQAPSTAAAVLAADEPDVVVILLGANDIYYRNAVADAVAARIGTLHAHAAAIAPHVLVATLLPNHRDPPELREAVNARIRAAQPDFLPLGERFAEADWEALLGDEIHPSAEGHEVLAAILEDELVRRALVPPITRRSRPPSAPAP